MSTSSVAVRRATVSALGPAHQPVSTGYPAGCWVHQVGTVVLENRNDRSARSRPPRSAHHLVANRSKVLTTLPNPISVLATAAFSRATGGSAISRRRGSGTVRIVASASRMAPS